MLTPRRPGLLILSLLLQVAQCVRRSSFRNKSDVPQQEKKKVMYIFLAIFLSCMCMCCLYVCSRVCPDGPVFSAIELDDIRIGRVHETENTLQQQIEGLQTRLTVQRMKRTNLETQRDVAATVEQRVETFNAKGQQIYGDAWDGKDGGTVPIKELVSIPDAEVREMRIEAQNIITARKAEEERDLWNIWNQYKEDPGAKKKAADGASNQSARTSGASTATGQPDVLTGRANRATKTTAAVSDARFGSGSGVASPSSVPSKPVAPIPPPRPYAVPQPKAVSSDTARPRPPIGAGPSRAPPPPRGPFARQRNEEKTDDDYGTRIHSSFHSPPPKAGADRVPLLSKQGSENGSSRPPPPAGPPPGWKGGAPPAKLAPLTGRTAVGGSGNVQSPPLAPKGVLPPRGTPPPEALRGRSSKKSS